MIDLRCIEIDFKLAALESRGDIRVKRIGPLVAIVDDLGEDGLIEMVMSYLTMDEEASFDGLAILPFVNPENTRDGATPLTSVDTTTWQVTDRVVSVNRDVSDQAVLSVKNVLGMAALSYQVTVDNLVSVENARAYIRPYDDDPGVQALNNSRAVGAITRSDRMSVPGAAHYDVLVPLDRFYEYFKSISVGAVTCSYVTRVLTSGDITYTLSQSSAPSAVFTGSVVNVVESGVTKTALVMRVTSGDVAHTLTNATGSASLVRLGAHDAKLHFTFTATVTEFHPPGGVYTSHLLTTVDPELMQVADIVSGLQTKVTNLMAASGGSAMSSTLMWQYLGFLQSLPLPWPKGGSDVLERVLFTATDKALLLAAKAYSLAPVAVDNVLQPRTVPSHILRYVFTFTPLLVRMAAEVYTDLERQHMVEWYAAATARQQAVNPANGQPTATPTKVYVASTGRNGLAGLLPNFSKRLFNYLFRRDEVRSLTTEEALDFGAIARSQHGFTVSISDDAVTVHNFFRGDGGQLACSTRQFKRSDVPAIYDSLKFFYENSLLWQQKADAFRSSPESFKFSGEVGAPEDAGYVRDAAVMSWIDGRLDAVSSAYAAAPAQTQEMVQMAIYAELRRGTVLQNTGTTHFTDDMLLRLNRLLPGVGQPYEPHNNCNVESALAARILQGDPIAWGRVKDEDVKSFAATA
jgi:hypothetical protein